MTITGIIKGFPLYAVNDKKQIIKLPEKRKNKKCKHAFYDLKIMHFTKHNGVDGIWLCTGKRYENGRIIKKWLPKKRLYYLYKEIEHYTIEEIDNNDLPF